MSISCRSVPFDVIGISYYPYWHGSLGELQYNLNDISARYDRDVIVVETAYAFTDQDDDNYPNIATQELMNPNYPFTPEGQRAMLRDVMAIVRGVDGGRRLGVFTGTRPGREWKGTVGTTPIYPPGTPGKIKRYLTSTASLCRHWKNTYIRRRH